MQRGVHLTLHKIIIIIIIIIIITMNNKDVGRATGVSSDLTYIN